MIKQKSGVATTIRCPKCKYENLAIDIWCERCGTPLDWKGAPGPAPAANGHAPANHVDTVGRSGLAGLAAGLPWRKRSATPASAEAPAGQASAAPKPLPVEAPPVVPEPLAVEAPPVVPKPVAAEAPPAPKPVAVEAPPVVPKPVAAEAPPAPRPVAVEAPAPKAVTVEPSPAPVAAAAQAGVEAQPAARWSRSFCPGCGQPNEESTKFCPRCGHAMTARSAPTPAAAASIPKSASRLPRIELRRIRPRVRLPRFALPGLRLPHLPRVAWAVAAVVAVLILAPLAYVLSPSGRHLVASRSQAQPSLTRTGAPVAAQSSALSAAIPGVEAKTGLKYTTGSCPSSSPCLRLAGQLTGLNAAAIQFSTAGSGGRQCVGYVYRGGGAWQFLNSTCALPGQLSPLVGNDATVHVPGQCANVRDSASLQGGIVGCINDGTVVHLDGGPNYADGKLWWHIEKNGWMAHDFLLGA